MHLYFNKVRTSFYMHSYVCVYRVDQQSFNTIPYTISTIRSIKSLIVEINLTHVRWILFM